MSLSVGVVGGGAAGQMAAVMAAQNGHRVTLLEKNEKLGKKLYITGKGRCNVTNDASRDEFLREVARNPRFLYSAVYGFDNTQVMQFFEENGCPLKIERGERVFPVSDHASDVTDTLVRFIRRNGGKILFHTEIKSLIIRDGRAAGVRCADGKSISADAVIVCTGGPTAAGDPSATEAGRMAEWLAAEGVDPARIMIEDHSLTTAQNAVFNFGILEQRCPQVRQIAIISSDYHIATGTLLFGAEAILRDSPAEVVSNAAWHAPSGSLSAMFQAGALIELSGNTETAFAVYYETYDIHELPPLPGDP